MIKRLESEGWQLVRTSGSHRQFKHPQNPSVITVNGKASDDMKAGTVADIARKAGWK